MTSTTSVLSRAALAAATSLTVSAALLGATAPAHADIVVDCLGGSLTVDQSIERVTITGTCVDVVVSGSNSVVTMPAAASLTVTGANNSVRLTRLPRLIVVGPNNLAVVDKGTTAVSVKGANNRIRVHERV